MASSSSHPSASPLRILLVEDDDVDAEQFMRMLSRRRREHEVTWADTLSAGVDLLEAGLGADVIVLDLRLTDASRLEGLETMLAHAPDTPVVVLTGQASEDLGREAIRQGAQDYLVKGEVGRELLEKSLHYAVERKKQELRLLHLARSLAEANERLRELSNTDSLTGLANRRLFDETLGLEWRRARRARSPLTLLLIDVDQFKAYNDACGHTAGDSCLAQVAEIFRTSARRAGELAARVGGEEFAVLLPGVEAEEALGIAERLRHFVETAAIPHPNSPCAPVVTVSVGCATETPSLHRQAGDLYDAADRALYRAKNAGRNRVECPPPTET